MIRSLLLLAMLSPLFCFSQNIITGTVEDNVGEPLIGAVVRLNPSVVEGVLTDTNGKFILPSVPNGKYKLSVTYVGYETHTSDVDAKNGLNLSVKLKSTNDLDEIIVTAKAKYDGLISGEVLNENLEKVVGASILVLETKKGTFSNKAGEFKMSNLKDAEYTIEASHSVFGEHTQTVIIKKGSQKELQFVLKSTLGLTANNVEESLSLITNVNQRNQDVSKVPLTLAMVRKNQMKDNRVDDFYSLSNLNANVSATNSWLNQPSYTIRGITSHTNSFYDEPRIAILNNGVPLGKMPALRPHDLQQVEILKGPQSVLLGAQAQAGAYNIVQAKAVNESSMAASASLGNYLDVMAQGYVNEVIKEGELYGRVSAFYNRRNGYVENLAGDPLNGEDTKAIRASAHYQPTEFIEFDGHLNFQRDVINGIAHKSSIFQSQGTTLNPFGSVNFDRGDLGIKRNSWNFSTEGTINLNNGMFVKTTTGYNRFSSFDKDDVDGTVASGIALDRDLKSSLFYQDASLHFQSTDQRTESYVGFSVQKENASRRYSITGNERALFTNYITDLHRIIDLNGDLTDLEKNDIKTNVIPFVDLLNNQGLPNDFYSSIPGSIGLYNTLFSVNPLFDNVPGYVFQDERNEFSEHTKKSSAVDLYGNATVHLTERLDASAGLRFSVRSRNLTLSAPESTDPSGLFLIRRAYPSAYIPSTTSEMKSKVDNTALDARLILDYKLSTNSKIYGSFSSGSKPHTVVELPGVQPGGNFTNTYIVEDFDKERISNLEVGLNGLSRDFKHRFNVSLYTYGYKNYIARSFNNYSVYRTAGDIRAHGGETSWTAILPKNFTANVSYAFNRARFNGDSPPEPSGRSYVFAGSSLLFSPDHSAAASIAKVFNSGKYNFTVAPSASYRSKTRLAYSYSPHSEQDGFVLGNLNITASDPEKQLSLSLFAENIIGKDYLVSTSYYGNAYGFPTSVAGQPLFFGGKIDWDVSEKKEGLFKGKGRELPPGVIKKN